MENGQATGWAGIEIPLERLRPPGIDPSARRHRVPEKIPARLKVIRHLRPEFFRQACESIIALPRAL